MAAIGSWVQHENDPFGIVWTRLYLPVNPESVMPYAAVVSIDLGSRYTGNFKARLPRYHKLPFYGFETEEAAKVWCDKGLGLDKIREPIIPVFIGI